MAEFGPCAPVYLLAGGKSSRFGSDKARALVQKKPLLSYVLQGLGSFPSMVRVVAREEHAYRDLGWETIADTLGGLGPMGGLHRALCDIQQRLVSFGVGESSAISDASEIAGQATLYQEMRDVGWLLLMPCDLLGVEEAWVRCLWAARKEGDRAVAFFGERWEPLCALYHVDLLPLVEERISQGQGALWRLLEDAKARPVALPEGWEHAVQANTPQALDAYLQRLQG
ncbi:MAG: molybdenum cofactor guanylyltransferase [Myxococcales bacterium]|nr:molybdenum cofactor guanylyltransferase [Myxococcales bacterium]MCB9643918.1 molybdenum cofactor guanylyltransferase [Myxococcales bacterium]